MMCTLTKHNIGLGSLLPEKLGIIQVPKDDVGVWVLGLDLVGFLLRPDKQTKLKFRVRLTQDGQGIAADVARSAGASRERVLFSISPC